MVDDLMSSVDAVERHLSTIRSFTTIIAAPLRVLFRTESKLLTMIT